MKYASIREKRGVITLTMPLILHPSFAPQFDHNVAAMWRIVKSLISHGRFFSAAVGVHRT
jgi:hypothetical protein